MPGAYLSDEDYQLVTNAVPIVCIDVLPVQKDESGNWNVGMIRRATGSQAGRLTLIGGRVQHSERIEDAIHRHIQTDLQLENFEYLDGQSESKPFMVQQYLHQDSIDSDEYGFDPTKNSIGLTYLIKIDGTPVAANEASEFHWISDIDGKEFGFNQQTVAQKALDFLNEQ
jgi:ADP-ribose pyrophosphatase YjhB (NUDIX family)